MAAMPVPEITVAAVAAPVRRTAMVLRALIDLLVMLCSGALEVRCSRLAPVGFDQTSCRASDRRQGPDRCSASDSSCAILMGRRATATIPTANLELFGTAAGVRPASPLPLKLNSEA